MKRCARVTVRLWFLVRLSQKKPGSVEPGFVPLTPRPEDPISKSNICFQYFATIGAGANQLKW
jgi:hypothetical protein